MSGYSESHIREKITTALECAHCEVVDESDGCGAKFAVPLVVSAQFEGKAPLARHRLVHAALAEEIKAIHAFSIGKAMTPAQWQKAQESGGGGASS